MPSNDFLSWLFSDAGAGWVFGFVSLFTVIIAFIGRKRPTRVVFKEVFSSVFSDYGFTLRDEVNWDGRGENTITASKGDIDITFYIGLSQMFYYCSTGIKLSGRTGEKATPHVNYRSMGISAIAKGMDPNYKRTSKGAQTKEEAKELFEIERDTLLKYCKGILYGWLVKIVRQKIRLHLGKTTPTD